MTQSYFVQDDVKLTPKLTLNVGLRYDLPGARTEAHDRFRTFDPNVVNPAIGIRGAIVGAAGQGGLQSSFRSLSPQDKSNIGPRLGAAYALNSKTVVRGGIGLYYAPLIYGIGGNGSLKDGTIGYNYDDYLTTPGAGAIPTQWLSTFQPLQTSNNNPGTQAVGTNSTVPYFDKNFKTGRTLQYTFDVQRELPYRFVASVGYIGHRDDRLRSNFGRLNALPLNALKLGFPILSKRFNDLTAPDRAYASSVGINIPTTANGVFTGFDGGCGDVQCTVAQALKPFPQYGRIDNYLESQGSSTYNAVQIKLDRRFAQGFQFGLAYTFSRLITNASEDILGGSPLDSSIQNPFDRTPLKTISSTNSPHVFVANFLAELPFGKGKKFLNQGGILNALFGGFQVSGIFRYQAGVPLVVTVSPDTGATGNSAFDNWTNLVGYYTNLRPNLTGQSLSTVTPCINIAPELDRRFALNCGAFAFPRDFTRPNAPVGSDAYRAFYADPTQFFGTSPVVNTNFRSPMYFSENTNLLKKTRLTETVFIEVGVEAFNLFNRSRFLQPDGNLGRFIGGRFDNGNFGQEGVALPVGPFGGNRVVQLRARLVF